MSFSFVDGMGSERSSSFMIRNPADGVFSPPTKAPFDSGQGTLAQAVYSFGAAA